MSFPFAIQRTWLEVLLQSCSSTTSDIPLKFWSLFIFYIRLFLAMSFTITYAPPPAHLLFPRAPLQFPNPRVWFFFYSDVPPSCVLRLSHSASTFYRFNPDFLIRHHGGQRATTDDYDSPPPPLRPEKLWSFFSNLYLHRSPGSYLDFPSCRFPEKFVAESVRFTFS